MKALLKFSRTLTDLTLENLVVDALRLESDPTTEHKVDLTVGATLENATYGRYYLNAPLVTEAAVVTAHDFRDSGEFADGEFGPFVYLANGAHGGAAATLTLERVVIDSNTTNEPGVKITGNGSGQGIIVASGDNAAAIKLSGASYGLHVVGAGAAGMLLEGTGNGTGLTITGAGTGHGVTVYSGSGTGNAINAVAQGDGHGLYATSNGTGDGVRAYGTNGINAIGYGAGSGVLATGGNTSGPGVVFQGSGDGAGWEITGGATGPGLTISAGENSNDAGVVIYGEGTGDAAQLNGGSAGGNGLSAFGGGAGSGIKAWSGDPGGYGIDATSYSKAGIVAWGVTAGIHATTAADITTGTNGSGLSAVGLGAGSGISATGGDTDGAGMKLVGIGDGEDLDADGVGGVTDEQYNALAKEATVLGQFSVTQGIIQAPSINTHSEITVTRGDTRTITFNLGTAWPLTSKKVWFTYKRYATDTTNILAAECTVTDAVNGIATYTPAATDFPNAGKFVYDVCTTATDGTAPQTAYIGTLKITQDVKL